MASSLLAVTITRRLPPAASASALPTSIASATPSSAPCRFDRRPTMGLPPEWLIQLCVARLAASAANVNRSAQDLRGPAVELSPRPDQRTTAPYGWVVDSVNVSVLLYVPVRSASLDPKIGRASCRERG